VKPVASVWRMIGFARSKCWWIGALVNAFLSFQNASSGFRVHSPLLVDFFCKLEIGAVTLAYLRMNRR